MTSIVLLDACVLIPYNLASLLLTCAEHDLLEPRWSAKILLETERNLVGKLGLSPELAERRVQAMSTAFPEASVAGYQHLESGLRCDAKDRHVLAAAIAAGADMLVTANLKDFPGEAIEEYGIEVLHPETFLIRLFSADPEPMLAAISADSRRRQNPTVTFSELLASLASLMPTFANCVNQWGSDASAWPAEGVLPVVAVEDETTPAAGLANPDLTDPLHVAMFWWIGVNDREHNIRALRLLTHAPAAFGDFQWAEEMLNGLGLASNVHPAVDSPEDIVFVRFVPEFEQSVQAFAPFRMSRVIFMTLVRHADGTWRVWGLGPDMVSARRVKGSVE